MKISISELTTYPADIEVELEAYSSAGFRAVELSLEKVSKYLAHGGKSPMALRERLAHLGAVASGAVSFAPQGPALLLSAGATFANYLAGLRAQLELCSELGAGVLCIGADQSRWLGKGDWRPQAIRNLREAASMAHDHGVRLGVEYLSLEAPIGPFLLESLDETIRLVDEAGHPALGICVDFFHHFRGGGTADELRALRGTDIANVHVTDVKDRARPTLEDADRALPGQGVAPISYYRAAILSTGYSGYWTLELLDPALWSENVAEVSGRSASAMREFTV